MRAVAASSLSVGDAGLGRSNASAINRSARLMTAGGNTSGSLSSSDGAANGFNYEAGSLSSDVVREELNVKRVRFVAGAEDVVFHRCQQVW